MLAMRSIRFCAFLVLTAAICTCLPGAALAQRCEAPPGSSAVEQYCEAIPEGGGTQSGDDFQQSRGDGSSSGDDSASGVSEATQQELSDAGADGAAIVGLAAGSSGGGTGGSGGASGPGSDAGESGEQGAVRGASAQGSEPSGSPLKAVSASVENGATIGGVFIWALLGITLLVAALAWATFRGRGNDAANADAAPSGHPTEQH